MVVPVNTASLRRWENPEDMDIQEVSGCLISLLQIILKTALLSVVIIPINRISWQSLYSVISDKQKAAR